MNADEGKMMKIAPDQPDIDAMNKAVAEAAAIGIRIIRIRGYRMFGELDCLVTIEIDLAPERDVVGAGR